MKIYIAGAMDKISIKLPTAKVSCPSKLFSCANGECIHKVFICNGISDCADKSDEYQCSEYKVEPFSIIKYHQGSILVKHVCLKSDEYPIC